MTSKVIHLRKKHQQFIYRGFRVIKERHDLIINLEYETAPDITFTPKITVFNAPFSALSAQNDDLINNLAFHLGLMEIFTYWKATCSPEIVILAGYLNPNQTRWWQNFLINGLGQFYVTNRINFLEEDFLKIKISSKEKYYLSKRKFDQHNVLVPIGGGKDSIVTLEISKKAGLNPKPFIFTTFGPLQSAVNVASVFGEDHPFNIHREIDKKLLQLNNEGYLNGHVPIAAHISFASLLAAVLGDCGKIAVSYERSANEGNLRYLGRVINHQYDKSWEFEKMFSQYVKNFICSDINYFSFLRPLYELQIAELFSQYHQYFSKFRSCNVGQKKNTWCGQCPKCLFIFVCLYAFLGRQATVKIFGRNLLETNSLISSLQEITGEKRFKPWECVGTYEETKIAFWLALKKTQKEQVSLPPLLKYFRDNIAAKEKNWDKRSRAILMAWNNDHHVPNNLINLLKENLKKKC